MKSTTCIVGWIEKKPNNVVRIWMGADSQVSHTSHFSKAHGYEKIFTNKNFLIGITGDVYATNLLQHVWAPPIAKVGQEVSEYLYRDVVPSIRQLFKDHGHARITNNQESNTENILIAYQGQLFTLYTDYCLIESLRPYTAMGCGQDYALGVCWHTHRITNPRAQNKNIEQNIRLAIQAAAEFSMGVDAQITIKHKEWKL